MDNVVLIGEEILLNLVQYVLLGLAEVGPGAQLAYEALYGAVDALGVAEQGRAEGGTADEADDVRDDACQPLARAALVGGRELALGELMGREFFAQVL